MMRQMRESAKWIMGILAAAFVGWMVFDVGMNVGAQGTGVTLNDPAASVNGTKITLQSYYAALRQAQDQRRQQFGSATVTLEDQRALEDRVLEELIQSVLLQQEYSRRGITVTDAEVIAAARTSPPPEVFQVPDFQTDGQFDMEKYQRYLASNADPNFMFMLEARYRDEIPRIKLYEQLTTDLYVSDAKLWQMYSDQNDSVEIQVLELRPSEFIDDSVVTVSDAEVLQYFDEHADEFQRPATAYTSYVTISRQTNAADSAAALERAAALKAEIDAGADFAEIARLESADSTSGAEGGDLGNQPNDRFIEEFTSAARALRPEQVSDPVPSAFGYHIIKLESMTRDSVHASHILIPVELAGDHLDLVESQADTLDLFAAEQTDPIVLDDVADKLGIPVLTAAPVADGNRAIAGGVSVPDAGLWAFDALPGETSPVIEAPLAFFVFRLDSIRPDGVPPFDDVEATVRRAAIDAKKWELAREMAAEIDAALRAGRPLMDVALANLLNARTLGPMTRLNPDPSLRGLPEVAGAGFGLGVGEPSGPIEGVDAIYFVEPATKILADSSAFVEQLTPQRLQVKQFIQQERLRLFLASLRNGADVDDRRRQVERMQRQLEDLADDRNPFNPLGF